MIATRPRTTRRPVESPPPAPVERTDAHALAASWQRALDAAHRAAPDKGLARERQEVARLLDAYGRDTGARPLPWLSPVEVTPELLGLPHGTQGVLLDLDGVLTDSGQIHARAWGEVLDDLLLGLADRLGWQFIPFDPVVDYRDFFDGRPRVEAIQAFLDSRGIRIPEGRRNDSPTAITAQGLARRKGETVHRLLHSRGVAALPGAHRYLDAAGRAGLRRAVVSASANTATMLEHTHLDGLVDLQIDAELLRAGTIRSRPAPDALLYACRRLGIDPAAAVAVTQSPAGVAAGHAAGMTVVGLGDGALLAGFGADRVAPVLQHLLDRRLL